MKKLICILGSLLLIGCAHAYTNEIYFINNTDKPIMFNYQLDNINEKTKAWEKVEKSQQVEQHNFIKIITDNKIMVQIDNAKYIDNTDSYSDYQSEDMRTACQATIIKSKTNIALNAQFILTSTQIGKIYCVGQSF